MILQVNLHRDVGGWKADKNIFFLNDITNR